MPHPLFAAAWPEASAAVGFAGNPLDRLSEERADDSAAEALRRADARLVVIGDNRFWIRQLLQEGEAATALLPPPDAEAAGLDSGDAVLLGWENGAPVLALALPPDTAPPASVQAAELRATYAQGVLPAPEMGILAQGASLLNWHRTHRFCARCGNPTIMRGAGVKRSCPSCGAEHFPRTDPVAIMLAALPEDGVREGRCLLGRGRHFPAGMYSCLAGFIEPGETVEDAVRRETFEESGVRLGRVLYHSSQPWPFPHSLMIGCLCEALGETIRRDEAELEDCRWFGRSEVLAMLVGTHADGMRVPPDGAIATHLIRAWAEG